VDVEVCLEGGAVRADTGVPFFDHMLDQLGRHGRVGLAVQAKGDLEVDAHHTVEDVGIVLGRALADALGDKRGIRRYGDALVPMDEALAQVALDISGRSLLAYDANLGGASIGQFDVGLAQEFLQALCRGAGLTLHVRLLVGSNPHHCAEAIFKSVGRALADAVSLDERVGDDVPSTKGLL
jgi:imidazoleglycerol-phosphate dehydratase